MKASDVWQMVKRETKDPANSYEGYGAAVHIQGQPCFVVAQTPEALEQVFEVIPPHHRLKHNYCQDVVIFRESETRSLGDPCLCGDTDTWHPECYQEASKLRAQGQAIRCWREGPRWFYQLEQSA